MRAAKFRAHLIVVMDSVAHPSPQAKDATKRLYANYIKGQETLSLESDEVVSTLSETEDLVGRIESDLKEMLLL